MAQKPLVLVSNPGSASRKYGLYRGDNEVASLHFEFVEDKVVGHCNVDSKHDDFQTEDRTMKSVSRHIVDILHKHDILEEGETIDRIGLRIVAPSTYFLENHHINDTCFHLLEDQHERAPLHIQALMDEINTLRENFPGVAMIGVSDSRFHLSKPDFAWNYGIPLADADAFEIKRFGYHGISLASVVRTLKQSGRLAHKTVVCHLGSGGSVTAILNGKSFDTTMGFAPLEGIVMSTRCGDIGLDAAKTLRSAKHLTEGELITYLNKKSGLLGIGGSNDIRELLNMEEEGNYRAGLALSMYVNSIQKAIGAMVAEMGGIDVLVFTGTVGERSYPIRERICERLAFLDILIDKRSNNNCQEPLVPTVVSRLARSKPVLVVPTDESREIAKVAASFEVQD